MKDVFIVANIQVSSSEENGTIDYTSFKVVDPFIHYNTLMPNTTNYSSLAQINVGANPFILTDSNPSGYYLGSVLDDGSMFAPNDGVTALFGTGISESEIDSICGGYSLLPSVDFGIEGQDITELVIVGNSVLNVYPTRAIINGKVVTSDNNIIGVSFSEPQSEIHIIFTHINKPNSFCSVASIMTDYSFFLNEGSIKSVTASRLDYEDIGSIDFTVYNQYGELTVFDDGNKLKELAEYGLLSNGDLVELNLATRNADNKLQIIEKYGVYAIEDVTFDIMGESKFNLSDKLQINSQDVKLNDVDEEFFFSESAHDFLVLCFDRLGYTYLNDWQYNNEELFTYFSNLIFDSSFAMNNDLVINALEDFCITFGIVIYVDSTNMVTIRQFKQKRGAEQWAQ